MNIITYYIAKLLSYPMELICGWAGAYGVAIIVFSLAVRLCLFPLYYESMRQRARMAAIQPEVDRIKSRYENPSPENYEEMKGEILELYEEKKANPYFGCFAMLIQMPFLFGVFGLLRYADSFPSLKEAAHQGFLWVGDLTIPDFTNRLLGMAVLATLLSLIVIHVRKGGFGDDKKKNAAAIFSMIVFPVLMFFIGMNAPAGVAVYWIVACLFSMCQNVLLDVVAKRKLEKIKGQGGREMLIGPKQR